MPATRNIHIQQTTDLGPYCDGLRIALEHLAQAAEQYLMEDCDEARALELRRNLGEAVTDASLVLHPKEPAPDAARLAAEELA